VSYAVLGGTTVTNIGPTVVTGDLGLHPGLAVVGFPVPGTVTGTTHAGDAAALSAKNSLVTAYNALTSQPCTVNYGPGNFDIGGLTLTPGVYCFASSGSITGTVTLNALGNPDSVFIFRFGSTLTTAPGSVVAMLGGSPCNVFWRVGSSATLNTTTSFQGNILALTSITMNTGASITGRALARNGAVTLDTNTINNAPCAAWVPPLPVPTLPWLAAVALMALLAMAGFTAMRRRATE
jgi:hypothetical protein